MYIVKVKQTAEALSNGSLGTVAVAHEGRALSEDHLQLRGWREGLNRTFLASSVATHAAPLVKSHGGWTPAGSSGQLPEDIYQFGVFTGGSLRTMRRDWSRLKLPVRKVWAFDSFIGLQKTTLDEHSTWTTGAYSAADAIGASSYTDLKRKILEHVADGSDSVKSDDFASRIRFIRGFFNDSLTPTLKASHGMRPAAAMSTLTSINTSRRPKRLNGSSPMV